jgi:hypothetical protein
VTADSLKTAPESRMIFRIFWSTLREDEYENTVSESARGIYVFLLLMIVLLAPLVPGLNRVVLYRML